jgi:CheY-like chemotaxis protein
MPGIRATYKSKVPETPPFPTVLVVEDHDDTREMLNFLLTAWGFRVVEACNGLEAVESASREKPQVILMDGRLPLVDGLEATRRIREHELLDHVKILALNGSGSPHYHAEALAAGCDDSIEKPFDIEKLRTFVVQALPFAAARTPAAPRSSHSFTTS